MYLAFIFMFRDKCETWILKLTGNGTMLFMSMGSDDV
jgi:hypothetical protein